MSRILFYVAIGITSLCHHPDTGRYIYKDNFLCEVVPKETCHVLLRQPLQRIEISMNKGCINETTLTHKREILHEGELMGQIRVDKTLELLKGKLLSPMRKDVQRHYPRYISCFKNTSKAMSHELYTPSPFANCTALVVGSDDVAPSYSVGVLTRRQIRRREGSRGARVVANY